MTYTESVLARISDPARRALVAHVWKTGDQLEAFHDGAIGGITDIRREESRLDWAYSKAKTALAEYDATSR